MTLIFNNGSINGSGGGGSGDSYTKAETNALLSVKASTSLDNLSAAGQMIIDSQNGTISNCILEIPQMVKLEITNDNKVMAKAGCTFVKQGNTYSTVTLNNDTSAYAPTNGWNNNTTYVLFGLVWGGLIADTKERVTSGNGTNIPSTGVYFNTTDKTFYYYSNTTPNPSFGYPLAVLKTDGSGNISFAKDSNGNDMIFNGAGFIGHHAFVYPNVKGLLANGIGADGTLSSLAIATSSLHIIELNANQTDLMYYSTYDTFSRRTYINEYDSSSTPAGLTVAYDKKNNNLYMYNNNAWALSNVYVPFVHYVYDGTTVTNFTISQPYEGARDLLTDSLQADVTTLTGYDSTQTQTLKNINGVLTWVTD